MLRAVFAVARRRRRRDRRACYNENVRRLTSLIAALALLTQTAACANYADRRFMMSAERALNTGVDAWETQIDAVIADCRARLDRKSTRLNSSHVKRSDAVFCV